MNRDDDFIAQLEDYLDTYEGVVPLPASVRSEVLARLPATRQVRASRGPERMLLMASRMSTPARFGIAVAAVLAIVVIGAAALNAGGNGPRVGAAPTPDGSPTGAPSASQPATSEPSSSPSASATTGAARLPAIGTKSCGPGLLENCLEPGSYQLASQAWPATITFELPTGWWPYIVAPDYEGVLVEHGDVPTGSGWGLNFILVGDVSRDPCDASAGQLDRDDTASVEQLVAAMQAWPDFDVSEPEPIEVDGYAGQFVEVSSTLAESSCPGNLLWSTPSGSAIDGYPMTGYAGQPRPGQFRILDVEGELLVIRTTDFADASPFEMGQGIKPDPERHAEDQVELRAIVESIRITP